MIAIVTGASAGLGAQFARQIAEQFPEIDTLWLIARRVGKLEDLAQTIEGKQVICLGLDLCDATIWRKSGPRSGCWSTTRAAARSATSARYQTRRRRGCATSTSGR